MPLKKNKKGSNMYPWVSHMHSFIGGECSHKCKYCYVDNPRFGRSPKYSGPIRIREEEFKVVYGKGQTIFIEHMNDLFASNVPSEYIERVIAHCNKYPDNTYVFQTKNPKRFFDFMDRFPKNLILGITIETNRDMKDISEAPAPQERYEAMVKVPKGIKRFLTIEPVLDFDVDILAKWIGEIMPDYINLGADSKNHHLPEPTVEKIMALVEKLKEYGVELREKHNLQRLMPK